MAVYSEIPKNILCQSALDTNSQNKPIYQPAAPSDNWDWDGSKCTRQTSNGIC